MENLISLKSGIYMSVLSGTYFSEDFCNYLKQIKDDCDEQKLKNILIDCSNVEGFFVKDDTLNNEAKRFRMAQTIYSIFGNSFKMAFISKAEYYNGLAEHILNEKGLKSRIFFKQNDAIEWLGQE